MGISEFITLWLAVRPIRMIRNRRRAKRGLPPLTEDVSMAEQSTVTMADGRTITKTEPLLPGRSSTKAATVGVVSVPLLQLLQAIPWPWPWVNDMVQSAAFAQISTIVVMYLTARFTKTPSDAGAI